MRIERLSLTDYRNIERAEFFPSDGVNVIYGENAQGKTNILEALWLLSGCRSFRGAKDSELIRFNCDCAKIQSDIFAYGRKSNIDISIQNVKKVRFNSVDIGSPIKLVGELGIVVFAPMFLQLISGAPALRRRFADTSLCQIRPAYAKYITEYNRALSQRNALLKSASVAMAGELLDIWDEKLAQCGEIIRAQRRAYTKVLTGVAAGIYEGLSGGREVLSLEYEEKHDGEAEISLLERLKSTRQTDIIYKTTGIGPHRDDISIFLDGKPARTYGSQGQMRSAAVAMKLAEAEIMSEKLGESPIILLDDVMSELDEGRQDYILNHIEGRQVFITCCDTSAVSRTKIGMKLQIAAGRIIE